MPFIGNQPALSYTSFAKQDFTTSATTSYTLDQPVTNANELALFINFVRQEPTTAYTASGTSLTLTSATSASDDMYCVFLGKAIQTINPPNGSVGISQLSATGTPSSSTFLRGDNSWVAAGGANTPAFQASFSTGNTLTNSTSTILQYNTELFDTDNCFDTSTYTFTPTVAGKYFLYAYFRVTISATGFNFFQVGIQKNGSTALYHNRYHNDRGSVAVSGILEANGSSDSFKAYGYHQRGSDITTYSDAGSNNFGAYKIIE